MEKNIFEDYIQNKKEEIIESLQKLIQIPSVYEKSEDKTKPFGKNANEALEYMLNLGKKLGFRTKNVDGYCGYIEFGEGEELLGIIGHLDVVPTGEGWKYPPFSATIQENKIYGRGAIDDKGPVISALYAMKTVMDNVKINKRVRLILGLNEENSWKCINYYKEHEEHPTIGFSPDADFPCIYAEKSILTHKISMPYKMENKKIAIIKIDCNNNPNNVVPRICKIDLKIDKIDIDELTSKTEEIIKKYNFNIEISKLSENAIRLISKGLEAHAAHPDLGINAISNLIIVLNEILKKYNEGNELLDFFVKYIHIDYNGNKLGINKEDESGKLTLNVGKFEMQDDTIFISMNLRIPINTTIEEVQDKFEKIISTYHNLQYKKIASKEHLYIPKDSNLVQTLCKIFNEENNSNLEPIAIGGATYARAFKNCVSFGANMPGEKDMCHQTNEFISIENLMFATKVYARVIYEL